MRVFLTVIILIFSLQSWTKAEDIRDLEIEGMSIGDSLLDYLTEEKIKKLKKKFYPKSKKYYRFEYEQGYEIYDAVTFHIKKDDKKYIIRSITGILDFPEKFKECNNC